MTSQTAQPFYNRPLFRFCTCVVLGLISLVGGAILYDALQEPNETKSTQLSPDAVNAQVAEAAELKSQGQLQAALDLLTPIRKEIFEQANVVGLRTFAESRAAVPEPRDAHILPAVAAFIRLVEIDSQDVDSRIHLFQLFRTIHDNKGALRFGNEAVALTPDNHRLRLLLAGVEFRAGNIEDAEERAQAVLLADADNIDAAALVVRCRAASGEDSAEILTLIDSLCEHADKKRAQTDRALLSLVLATATNDTETARLLADSFQPQDINAQVDHSRAEMIVAALDSTGRSKDTLSAAAASAEYRSSANGKDSHQKLSAIRRHLWAGEHQQVLAATKAELDASSESPDEANILRFMSLWLENDRTELRELANTIAKFETHRAHVWTPVLKELAADEPQTALILQAASDALKCFPDSPCLGLLKAESLTAIGDTDGAIVAFRKAINASPRWAHARIRLAELLTERSQPKLAFAEALEAVKAVPHSTRASRALIVSVTRLREAGIPFNDKVQHAMVNLVKRARDTAADSTSRTVLDATQHFLNDNTQQADTLVSGLLSNAASSSAADLMLLETLASTDALQQAVNDARRSTLGPDYNELLADCVQAAQTAGAAAILLYLDTAKLGTQKLPEVSQRILYAETLSKLNHQDAKAAWIALANDHPTELRIQQRAAHDAALIDDFSARQKIVDNIKAASAEETIVYRVEATRLLLDKDHSQQTAAQAALTMTELLKTAPMSTQAMRLAIRAFERLDKPDRALVIVRSALSSGMQIPEFQLRLAEQSSTRDEAVRSAKSFLATVSASSPLRIRAVNVLLRHGDYRTAAHELSVDLPDRIEDTDAHFERFSTLAMALAYDGSVKKVLGPIESLAPKSNRWFKLWIDITEVTGVAPEDAFAMLNQAADWSGSEPESRKRQLSVAWRRLAGRNPDKRCWTQALTELHTVVDKTADASEQMLLAGLAIKADRPEIAVEVYESLVAGENEQASYHAIALNNLASLKLTSGADLRAASDLADRAWQLQQKPEFVDTLIEIRLKQNRKQDALILLEEGMQKWPHNQRFKRLAARLKPTSPLLNDS